jgi:hypothetical protein
VRPEADLAALALSQPTRNISPHFDSPDPDKDRVISFTNKPRHR